MFPCFTDTCGMAAKLKNWLEVWVFAKIHTEVIIVSLLHYSINTYKKCNNVKPLLSSFSIFNKISKHCSHQEYSLSKTKLMIISKEIFMHFNFQ